MSPDSYAASTITMSIGAVSELLIRDPNRPHPVVTGDAIALIPVVNVTDSGLCECEIRAVTPGSATIDRRSPYFVITVAVS